MPDDPILRARKALRRLMQPTVKLGDTFLVDAGSPYLRLMFGNEEEAARRSLSNATGSSYQVTGVTASTIRIGDGGSNG